MNSNAQINDWIAIQELKARYCRYLDTKQWDAWSDLFTEDYELDVSQESGLAPIVGRAKAIAMVRSIIETARTAHQVHSPEISIEGDEATAVWAMQDRLLYPGGQSVTGFGHYHERLVRRGGQWRIASLKLTRLVLEQENA